MPYRVVVSEDQGGCIVQQSLAQHLTGMHARAVDGAAEELLEGDQAMPVVEIPAAYLNHRDKRRYPQTRKPNDST
jgi:hypothetical protein